MFVICQCKPLRLLLGSKDLSVPNRVQLAMELKDIDKVREILKDGKNGWKEVS